MRVGAFVMTYNRAAVLSDTLHTLLTQTRPPDEVLVVDNGSMDNTGAVVQRDFPNVAYIRLLDNLGPAGAACVGLSWGVERGFDWIYWGDDDDPPGWSDVIERLLNIPEVTNCEDVGGVGVAGALWDWEKGSLRRIPDRALSGVVSVDNIAGNQQWMVRRQAVEAVGLPNAKLFFGFEELEYCLRMRLEGYRLLVDGELMLESRARFGRLGLTERQAWVGLGTNSTAWSRRQYYSTRNYIYMMNHIFRHPELSRKQAFKAIAKACLSYAKLTKHGIEYSNLQLRAIWDGYSGRMGRTISLR
jgi:glycosyltransferase involved in cell wall biosynthesis